MEGRAWALPQRSALWKRPRQPLRVLVSAQAPCRLNPRRAEESRHAGVAAVSGTPKPYCSDSRIGTYLRVMLRANPSPDGVAAPDAPVFPPAAGRQWQWCAAASPARVALWAPLRPPRVYETILAGIDGLFSEATEALRATDHDQRSVASSGARTFAGRASCFRRRHSDGRNHMAEPAPAGCRHRRSVPAVRSGRAHRDRGGDLKGRPSRSSSALTIPRVCPTTLFDISQHGPLGRCGPTPVRCSSRSIRSATPERASRIYMSRFGPPCVGSHRRAPRSRKWPRTIRAYLRRCARCTAATP